MKKLAILPISIYRVVPQLFLKGILFPLEGSCRYIPTCSTYATEAISEHGVVKGLLLAVKRIGRCHPLGGSGYDPVPLGSRQSNKKRL